MISEFRTEVLEVQEDDRLSFLPSIFGKNVLLFMSFENAVYNVARNICKEYDGGYWDYYTFYENGGFMALPESDMFTVFDAYGATYSFNGVDLGLIATIEAVKHLSQLSAFNGNLFLLRANANLMNLVADRKNNENILRYMMNV